MSPNPLPGPADDVVADVVNCFDAYTRVRLSLAGVLNATYLTERDEERAFSNLIRAVTRLRHAYDNTAPAPVDQQ